MIWEYKILRGDARLYESELNNLGQENWEAVGMWEGPDFQEVIVFKRPKS